MMEKKHEITGTVKIRLYVIFPAQSQSPWNREVSVYTGSCPVLKQQSAAMNCSVKELHPLTELSVIKRPDKVFIQ